MMTDKALADTLELMAAEIAALKRQIGELQQRERVDSNRFSISTHNHSGTYLPLGANGVFEIGANDGVADHALFDLHTSTTVRDYDARFGVYSGQTVFRIVNVLGGGVDAAAPLMEAGQRVFSPNNPQVVAFATPATLHNGSLTVNQIADFNVTGYGVPSGAQFVLLQLDMVWGAANGLITVSRGQTAENDIIVRAPAANVQTTQGIVKCRVANNLIRFVNKNATASTAYIRLFGYEM